MGVSFRTNDGLRKLRAYHPGKPRPDGREGQLWANSAADADGADEVFRRVPSGGDTFGLEVHGKYWSFQPNGDIEVNRDALRSWEKIREIVGEDGTRRLVSAAFGYTLVAENDKRVFARADNREILLALDGPVAPPASGEHPDPLIGQLEHRDGAFRVRGQARNVVGIHLGDLIGQGLKFGIDHIVPAFRFARGKGMHTKRSWYQLHTEPGGWWDQWPASRWSPLDNFQRFCDILRVGAEHGTKWVLSGGGIRGLSNGQQDELFHALADAISVVGVEHVAMVETLNEVHAGTGNEDDNDPAELERLLTPIRSRFPQLLCSLSATGGTEDRNILRRYTPHWMAFYMIHGSREGRAHDKFRHMFSMANTGEGPVVRKHAWWNEPFGGGHLVSGVSNKHELTDHVMEAAACMAAMTGGQWTVMSGPGVIYGHEPLEHMPGMNAPAVVRQLPQDLGTFQIIGHGGAGKPHRIWAALDDWRADYAIHHDGRFVAILYGPPEQHRPSDLRKVRDTKEERIILDGPWARVVTGVLA